MAETKPVVEVTTKYVTTVDDLPAAWAFVMERIDSVGPDPRISISPIHVQPVSIAEMFDDPDAEHAWKREFEVVVSGIVEEAPDA